MSGTEPFEHSMTAHECGLFSESQWIDMLSHAGFQASVLPFVHSDVDDSAVVFLGKKPPS